MNESPESTSYVILLNGEDVHGFRIGNRLFLSRILCKEEIEGIAQAIDGVEYVNGLYVGPQQSSNRNDQSQESGQPASG
jgi:hypothetical protein